MRKKVILVLVILLVVIGVGLAVLAANLGRIVNSRKGEILAQVQARTGREITIGEVGVALWPGLGVRVANLSIADDPAFHNDVFVRARDLRVNVKLLPLLRKRVEVKRLVLVDPQITIIKGEGKRFNFTSMIEALAPPVPPGGGPAQGRPAAARTAAVIALADIDNGTVRFIDRTKAMDRTVRAIDLEVRDAGFTKRVRATVSAAVFGEETDVKIDAAIGPLGDGRAEKMAAAPISGTIEFGPAHLADLAAFRPSPGKPAQAPPEGRLSGRADISGTLGAVMLESAQLEGEMFGANDTNVKVTASGGPFNVLGDSTQIFAKARVKGQLDAGPLPLESVKLASKNPSAPPPRLGGEATASASFEGEMNTLNFQGKIDATRASIDQPPKLSKAAGVPATANVSGMFRPRGTDGEGIRLDRIDVVFHSVRATGTGRIVPFAGRKSTEIELDARTSLGPLAELMPSLVAFAPSGDANARIRMSRAGDADAPLVVSGTATFSNVSATVAKMPQKLRNGSGRATFTAKSASIEGAEFLIGKSAFRMKADATSLTPLVVTYEVTSPEVWRADVQVPAPNVKRPEVFRSVVARGRMQQKAPRVVENEVEITSNDGVASNLDYNDFTASVRTTPEKVFIDSFNANVLGGKVQGSGTFEPKESRFDVKTNVTSVNLTEYFRHKFPSLTNVLAGRINANLSISGAGKKWEEVQKTLEGGGDAFVIEGALLNVNMLQQMIGAIEGVPLIPASFGERIRVKNPKLFAENKTMFENLKGKVTIAGGRLQTENLQFVTSEFTIAGNGWFSFTKEMDVDSRLTFSEAFTRQILEEVPAARYILSPQGRLEVPLALSGAILKPKVTLDTAALAARAQGSVVDEGKKKVEDEIKDGIKGLLGGMGKKKEPPKPPVPPGPDTTKTAPKPAAPQADSTKVPPDTTKAPR